MYHKTTINEETIEEYRKILEQVSEGEDLNKFRQEILKEIENMESNIIYNENKKDDNDDKNYEDNSKEIFIDDLQILKLIAIVNNDKEVFEVYKNAINFANEKNINIENIYNKEEIIEIERMFIKKEREKILEKITKIEFKDGTYKVYGDINEEELLILAGDGYKKMDSLKEGEQAEVNDLEEIKRETNDLLENENNKKFIIRVQDYSKNEGEIENNSKVLTQLKEVKKGSTLPIANFIIEKSKKIEICRKRENGDLRDYLESHLENIKNGSIENENKLSMTQFIYRLLGAVENIHIANGIHRDIKLENICLDKNNNPKFIDFSFAATLSNREDLEIVGTPIYLAPEIFEEQKIINQKNDIYSLGISILELLLKTDYKGDFLAFIENKGNKNFRTLKQLIYYVATNNLADFIEKDDLDLSAFNIIENKENEDKINILKEKLINMLKHMIQNNPENRYDIFQVKEEFEEIKNFIIENNLEETREKNLNISKFRKHLEKLLNRPIEEEKNGVIYEKGINSFEELDSMFKNTLIEKQSEKVKNCIEYLYNCIDENNNISLPSEEFYNLLDENFKEDNKGKLTVIAELAELKKLKLTVYIEKSKRIFKENGQKLDDRDQEDLKEIEQMCVNMKKMTVENQNNINLLKQNDLDIIEKIEKINSIFEKPKKTIEHNL